MRSSPAGMGTGSFTSAVPTSSLSQPLSPDRVRVHRMSVWRLSASTLLPVGVMLPLFVEFTVVTTASFSKAWKFSDTLTSPCQAPGFARRLNHYFWSPDWLNNSGWVSLEKVNTNKEGNNCNQYPNNMQCIHWFYFIIS
eukprot:763744-Hanusia_phi.AAC.7